VYRYIPSAKALAFFILWGVLAPLPGQCSQASATGGTIQGTVTDPTGAVVPDATVTLSNGMTGYEKTVHSAPDGSFKLVNVPPNHYVLQVASRGLQTYKTDLDVRTNVPLQVKAAMVLSNASETVTVTASADALENVPTAHIDVDQNLMSNLPIQSSGQGLSDAITLSSGSVVADSNGFFHPQGDHGETTYVIDGQPISDQQNKTFSTQIPANAFQSMELVSSAQSAEYGDKTGLIVNAQTRSGLGQKTSFSFSPYYGSFGAVGEDATFGVGGPNWGNFLVVDSSRSGRFLDSPEFYPMHDIGNTENIFDRVDYQPGGHDSIHLDMFGGRNWFQIPNTYDQPNQDQRQQATTLSLSAGYQHTFNAETLLSITPFYRQDHVQYYPSRDPFGDVPASLSQNRHLTNWGTRADVSYSNGIHNVKVGTQLMQTRLNENLALGLTVPFSVCAVGDSTCSASGPDFSPGLLPFDIAQGGRFFQFTGSANINQQAIYAQDQITFKNLTVTPGVRWDHYAGISHDNLVQPRLGLSYLVKRTGTVLRASFDRTMETPYNENLVVSSTTGAGGLAGVQFGGFGETALRPGHRNQYDTGFQQALGKYLQVEADYFWKYTKNAFDFDTLFNTPLAFPISWRQSKIDGFSARFSTKNIHGFQAYTTLGHTRARFFGPEVGGLIFNSPLSQGAFRIDHDQEFQQTTFLRYQWKKDGPWGGFTWRYDSGEVAGSVTGLADALALTADQQAQIGFFCGNEVATLTNAITSCSASNFGARRVRIPAEGTADPDHNPPRISPRNLFDVSVGTDNLFHTEKLKTTLKLTAVNITNEVALYNFLSTFSGTHFVTPRSYEAAIGWTFN
jgi:Carboxypeptidase regulatory-like domain/TonB-dependent Receptor Plug Domain